MPKFYVHRTNLAWITEVNEIEAADHDEADRLVDEGDGTFVGVHIGDYSEMSQEETEVFTAEPHNLPSPFYPAKAAV